MRFLSLPSLLLFLGISSAQVTVYYEPQTALTASSSANYTGAAAYNTTTLSPPSPPASQLLPTQFTIQLNNAVPAGVSIPQNGSFFGFSIEMSVVNQVCTYNNILYIHKTWTKLFF